MKKIISLLVAGLIPLLAGCSTPRTASTVVLPPVGPNPASVPQRSSTGSLVIYSQVTQKDNDGNIGGSAIVSRPQYSDYEIYTLQGQPLKHVFNGSGNYGEGPESVVLTPGQYLVKARAKDYFWVKVPVTVLPGRTTIVHLDDKWTPPPNTPRQELVTAPNGAPVGWSATYPLG